MGLGLLPLLLGFGKLDLRTPPTLLDNTPQSRTFSRTHARTIFHAQQISTQNSGQLPTSIQACIFIPSAYFLSMGGTSACCDEKIPLVKISTSSSPLLSITASLLRLLCVFFLLSYSSIGQPNFRRSKQNPRFLSPAPAESHSLTLSTMIATRTQSNCMHCCRKSRERCVMRRMSRIFTRNFFIT